jgi:hypothetical protein
MSHTDPFDPTPEVVSLEQSLSSPPDDNQRMGSAAGSSARIAYCPEAESLLNGFAETVREVIQLLKQQFEAIMSGDSDAARFDLLIYEASERKQNAKYAYLAHLESHGCSVK